ncbi:DUF6414 family protein [Halococcus agarilyticus]|uniref:DUF6414 family protein n=1 Tax=Halococcus agarilyticus TaxID=1232219 RepID=UPI0012AB7AED|nr:hypothetical protein [Halococcus agarilyticus]
MTKNDDSAYQLREFIYLDDESINGHLSSLGVGLQTSRTKTAEDENESESHFSATIPTPWTNIGGGGRHRSTDREGTEQQIDITVPYRFQELLRQIDGISEIKDPDIEDVERGDVIEISGTVKPMSLFRLELAAGAINTLTEESKKAGEVITDDNSGEENVSEEEIDASEAFIEMSENVIGNRVPVRLDTDRGHSYATVLKRNYLRVPTKHAFAQAREYTLFGRVEEKIERGKKWHPVDMMRLTGEFAHDAEEGIDDFNKGLQEAAKGMDVILQEEDLTLMGPANVIYPIGLFW